MQLTQTAQDLYDEIAELTIIDAHEHLPCEADYLTFDYSGPNLFAGGYIWHDLESAGMSSAGRERATVNGSMRSISARKRSRPKTETNSGVTNS